MCLEPKGENLFISCLVVVRKCEMPDWWTGDDVVFAGALNFLMVSTGCEGKDAMHHELVQAVDITVETIFHPLVPNKRNILRRTYDTLRRERKSDNEKVVRASPITTNRRREWFYFPSPSCSWIKNTTTTVSYVQTVDETYHGKKCPIL
jgi:hypothetical protein